MDTNNSNPSQDTVRIDGTPAASAGSPEVAPVETPSMPPPQPQGYESPPSQGYETPQPTQPLTTAVPPEIAATTPIGGQQAIYNGYQAPGGNGNGNYGAAYGGPAAQPPYAPQPQPAYTAPLPAPAQTTYEQRRRMPILGPALLILAGVLILLNNFGMVSWNIWPQILRLWPLLLVALGLELLIGRRNPAIGFVIVLLALAAGAALIYANGGFKDSGNLTSTTLNVPAQGATAANLTINTGISELTLDTQASGDTYASGSLGYFQNDNQPTTAVNKSGDTLNVNLNQEDSKGFNFAPWFNTNGNTLRWDVHMNPQVPTNLDVNLGVGKSTLNLANAAITGLVLRMGVGDTEVTMPESPKGLRANINGGVGNLRLLIPAGVEARVQVQTGLGNVNVDNRFTKVGDNTYQTANYNSGDENRLDLTLESGVGNTTIRTP